VKWGLIMEAKMHRRRIHGDFSYKGEIPASLVVLIATLLIFGLAVFSVRWLGDQVFSLLHLG
jgi:hypothetical protein